MREPIPEAKLAGLRQLLDRGEVAHFHRGSSVELVTCSGCKGRGQIPEGGRLPNEETVWLRCERCKGECSLIAVTGPWGGVSKYALEDIRHAYALALDGPPRIPQPKGDPTMFGADPPF